MNQLPRLESLMINDSVIDDVIANMSDAFQDEGTDQSTLQQLKQVWRSKLQKRLQEDPTDAATEMDAKSADTTKEEPNEEPKEDPKQEPVAVQQAVAHGTNKFAPVAVTGGVQLGMKWKLHEFELPKIERSTPGRRMNVTLGKAVQLDGGGLTPIKEEPSEEEDADWPEKKASRPRVDEESLNSDDDLSGEETDGDDLFESDNVIACQFNKVGKFRENWRFELCDGVMTLNGKDYVFKELTGWANF